MRSVWRQGPCIWDTAGGKWKPEVNNPASYALSSDPALHADQLQHILLIAAMSAESLVWRLIVSNSMASPRLRVVSPGTQV